MFSHNYWPNNGRCIPYLIHPGFGVDAWNVIKSAMRHIEQRTQCLSFKPRTNEADYISIAPHTSRCMSRVGRTPGNATEIKLGKQCLTRGIIVHELMHALGFYHEHNRPDRDIHVQVFPAHVQSGMYYPNFRILTNMSTYGVQYDVESIMHYAPWDFAVNKNQPAMIPRYGHLAKMGQRWGLSKLDEQKIQRAYGCIDDNLEKVELPLIVCDTKDAFTSTPVSVTNPIVTTLAVTLPAATTGTSAFGTIVDGLGKIDWLCTERCTDRSWCLLVNPRTPANCRDKATGCDCSANGVAAILGALADNRT
ncbi:hatching enzyme 1.2-like isoform X2 [Paramacrobiotus metropolitanus]|nr:hatching enzyme 1.2-like isoform X2 [Paramacrobiotus metropolitanus]XP_055350832.1 hatching enzyme 1.2-like isoform X2 [Paramacrobiotus metropolitanus]